MSGYLDARGKDNVAQVAVDRDGFEGALLIITCQAGSHDKLPDIVTGTDVIIHPNCQYDVYFVEDPWDHATLDG